LIARLSLVPDEVAEEFASHRETELFHPATRPAPRAEVAFDQVRVAWQYQHAKHLRLRFRAVYIPALSFCAFFHAFDWRLIAFLSDMNPAEAQRFIRLLYRNTPRRPHLRTTLCRACIRSFHGRQRSIGSLYAIPELQKSRNGRPPGRNMATVASAPTRTEDPLDYHGPIAEYDLRVRHGKLRNDEHQRSMYLALHSSAPYVLIKPSNSNHYKSTKPTRYARPLRSS
jgi:hypothetical protein